MKTLIIGYGVSGKGAEVLLKSLGVETIVLDRKGPIKDDPDFPLHDISLIVLSPGIPATHPIVQRAGQIEVIGEIELGARYLKNRSFGVTGANGKTSTVLLTEHILNSRGVKAKALGNVGQSLSQYAVSADPNEILIVELSSFQLETLKTKFLEVGLILNITPNHLDRYASMQEYIDAKVRMKDLCAEFYISEQVESLGVHAKRFDLKEAVGYTTLEMPSKQSIQAAYLLCKRCGVTDQQFLHGLQTFKKPSHRIEWVAKINNVSYYNDSKSSNIDSVMHAVERVDGPIVLIAGGVHKGSSYKPWIEVFRGKVRQMIAYGQAAPLMEVELARHIPLVKVDRFADAVNCAKEMAKSEETVLLSPGCSSYDQFQSYEHRGDTFKRLVKGEM